MWPAPGINSASRRACGGGRRRLDTGTFSAILGGWLRDQARLPAHHGLDGLIEPFQVFRSNDDFGLDLRTIAPIDRASVLALARQTGRVLILQEDSRTGGIGESLAAIIQEEAFEWLDAPVRIVGALDTPVPYSPPLEDVFLPTEADVERAARCLMSY